MKFLMFLMTLLLLLTVQAAPVQLESSVKDYFQQIKEEAQKDGVLLEYSILNNRNGLLLTIFNEANNKDGFHIIYLMETASNFRTRIIRDGASAYVQDRSDSYIKLNNFVVENHPDAEELLKTLDKTFTASIESFSFDAIKQQDQLLNISPIKKNAYKHVAKNNKTYKKVLIVFILFTGHFLYEATTLLLGLPDRPLSDIAVQATIVLGALIYIIKAKAFYSKNYKFSDIKGLALLADKWRKSVYDKNQLSCKNVF